MAFTLVVCITDWCYFAPLTCEREIIRGVAEALSRSLEHHHLLLAPLGVLYLTPPTDFNPIPTQSIHPKIHNPSEDECCSTKGVLDLTPLRDFNTTPNASSTTVLHPSWMPFSFLSYLPLLCFTAVFCVAQL